jgi:hypothetical protein
MQKINLPEMKITAASFQVYKLEFYRNDSSFLHSFLLSMQLTETHLNYFSAKYY